MAYDRTNPGTKLENLINPEVLAEFISYKLEAAIKFAPLCGVNRDLQGRPGDTLTLPKYTYIGDADVVPEGADVEFGNLGKKIAKVTVNKAGRGVKITDEALLNAYGNPADEIAKQLLMAIANKVDNDCVAQFRNASEKMTLQVTGKFNKDAVIDMIAKFGEDMEEDMVLVINAQQLAEIRKDEAFMHVMNGQATISGEIGQIFGARVVVSNKVQPNEAFLVKQGAVKILLKRDVMVEADRDIINKTNIFVVDEHYAVYLEDDSKLVKATIA
jgi:N4-gp56 family major capsid protein